MNKSEIGFDPFVEVARVGKTELGIRSKTLSHFF